VLFFQNNSAALILNNARTASSTLLFLEKVPKLENILDHCPNLQTVTLSFGMRSVDVTPQALEAVNMTSAASPKLPLASLKSFTVHTYMTKRALEYLWARAVNLVSIFNFQSRLRQVLKFPNCALYRNYKSYSISFVNFQRKLVPCAQP
jgi:hypothetical protein